ncbi:MAG TPA: ABATE domain-containing protein [Solirubrobacteraceae bacterium]|nr:ABATE domain-containing protein [Solirubrobacteraceae bacterium]
MTEEPGSRAPAPEPIRLVQRFINTNDRAGVDLLGDADALGEWLAEAGLLDAGGRVSPAEHAGAIRLRESLRDLVGANAGLGHSRDSLAVVNAAGRRAGLFPVLTGPADARLEPAAGRVDAALGRIVAAVHAGIADGTWVRLKACERETCRWAFYDQSKNAGGHWCSMAVCGAREKSRRAYRRRRAAEAD